MYDVVTLGSSYLATVLVWQVWRRGGLCRKMCLLIREPTLLLPISLKIWFFRLLPGRMEASFYGIKTGDANGAAGEPPAGERGRTPLAFAEFRGVAGSETEAPVFAPEALNNLAGVATGASVRHCENTGCPTCAGRRSCRRLPGPRLA
jgi:hypothetical protein